MKRKNRAFIIGFSGKMGSGKSEAASGTGLPRFAFGDALKDTATREFGWDRKKDDRGRRLLQVIGTECGRAYNPDIWVERLDQAICNSHQSVVVVDDVRFPNEASFINERGLVIEITRTRSDRQANGIVGHESEVGLSSKHITHTVVNNGTIERLHHTVMKLIVSALASDIESLMSEIPDELI